MQLSAKYIIAFIALLEVSCHGLLFFPWESLSSKLLPPITDLATILSILYPLSGTLLVASVLYFLKKYKNSEPATSKEISCSWHHLLILVLLLSLTAQYYIEILVSKTPLNYQLADMLPVMDYMSFRFINGEMVYLPIPEIWEGMQPIYLPAMWMPFILHHILDIDMRWICMTWMMAGTAITYFILVESKLILQNILLISVPIILIWTIALVVDPFLLPISEEGITIGYYLLLAFALLRRKWILLGIAISLCLLSRYALAPWVFCFIPALYYYGDRKTAFIVLTTIVISVVLLMIISQAYLYLDVFLSLPDQYLQSSISDSNKYLPMIRESLGFAKFFTTEQYPFLHTLFKSSSVGIPVIGFILYPLFRTFISLEFYALCILKLSLVAFFNLLILPYSYLFYTSTFVSMSLLAGVLNNVLESSKDSNQNISAKKSCLN